MCLVNLVSKSLSIMLVVSILSIVACSGDDNGPTGNNNGDTPGPNEIWMQSISFVPNNKTISVGTTITWINKDAVVHTATSGNPGNPSGSFNSGNIQSGGTFSFTFDSTGTYPYYCIPHQNQMQGTITVQ